MKKLLLLSYFLFAFFISCIAQTVSPPDKIYGKLFVDVQMSRIFPDNKTFVDCIPKRNPKDIVADYIKMKNNPAIKFSLKNFVDENFILPSNPTDSFHTETNEDIKTHINRLWDALKRNPDAPVE